MNQYFLTSEQKETIKKIMNEIYREFNFYINCDLNATNTECEVIHEISGSFNIFEAKKLHEYLGKLISIYEEAIENGADLVIKGVTKEEIKKFLNSKIEKTYDGGNKVVNALKEALNESKE